MADKASSLARRYRETYSNHSYQGAGLGWTRHWEGCDAAHPVCALLRLADAVLAAATSTADPSKRILVVYRDDPDAPDEPGPDDPSNVVGVSEFTVPPKVCHLTYEAVASYVEDYGHRGCPDCGRPPEAHPTDEEGSVPVTPARVARIVLVPNARGHVAVVEVKAPQGIEFDGHWIHIVDTYERGVGLRQFVRSYPAHQVLRVDWEKP